MFQGRPNQGREGRIVVLTNVTGGTKVLLLGPVKGFQVFIIEVNFGFCGLSIIGFVDLGTMGENPFYVKGIPRSVGNNYEDLDHDEV